MQKRKGWDNNQFFSDYCPTLFIKEKITMNKKFFTGSKVYSENALFQNHVSNYSNYLYDQNFIWLKKEPSTLELDDINTKFMSKWLNDSPLFKFDFKPSA